MLTTTNVTWLDLLCLTGVTAGVYLVRQVVIKKNPAPYPPGPQGWPLIGNILDMPRVKPWLTFTEWGQKYGDITHIKILGRHIIVLNSVKVAMETMDSKSIVYSDRPVLPILGELVGWKNALPFMAYGDRFRLQRRNFHQVIGTRAAVEVYNMSEEVEIRRFLKRVLAKPDQLQEHIRHTVGTVILRISHGYEVQENNDPFIDLANRVTTHASQAAAPSAVMIDILPFLAKVPAWFPGAGFKRMARKGRENLEEMVSAPHKFVKDQMFKSSRLPGIAPVSFTSTLLEGSDVSAEEDHGVKWSAFSLITGGTDTDYCCIILAFFSYDTFPDVQRKAQAEIDAVVGPDRFPTFADRDSLPYTNALVKEILRWHVVSPAGLPHCVTKDDIHDGYYIPKGSIILLNIWFMLNDPRTYVNPSQFNPERFLAKDGKEPEMDSRTACFGFGRRICPALHLADAFIWIFTAMSLAAFDISKVVEHGVEITPAVDPSTASSSHPKPFKCSIKPRSAIALELIEQDANY
ncbi:cytochrome P450 [Suillus discolor]|uniref:Cytochrome P450 n=1 Tax=Suillus discolor TaxID=1912936 RepID=A0A9P7FHW4_9AGAM|nr:cytochrome P450 [Suillus discolor]KAG2117033.1 cytochrome P450 [Suillus discolor]